MASKGGKARAASLTKEERSYFAKRAAEWRWCTAQLNNAIRSGVIKRPARCPSCQRRRFVEAHHRDHTKPFEMEWVCTECHGLLRERLCMFGDLTPEQRQTLRARAKRMSVLPRTLVLTIITDWLERTD